MAVSNSSSISQTSIKTHLNLDIDGPWTKKDILSRLYKQRDSVAATCDSAILKAVNAAHNLLKQEGYKLKGVRSDGDCFFEAFYKSYKRLNQKICQIDDADDPTERLREDLSNLMEQDSMHRAREIRKPDTWIDSTEGIKLAKLYQLPIRILTVHAGNESSVVIDDVVHKVDATSQSWVSNSPKPSLDEILIIVDLGRHFLYAIKEESSRNFDHNVSGRSKIKRKIDPDDLSNDLESSSQSSKKIRAGSNLRDESICKVAKKTFPEKIGPSFEAVEKKCLSAIDNDEPEALLHLLPKLPNGINTRLEWGCNLLMAAVDKNAIKCAEALIRAGVRIEDHEREYTPLFTAAENGSLSMVELLLKYGSNLTGEFDFDAERADSIAAFKFCEIFMPILEKDLNNPAITDYGKKYINKALTWWSKLFECSLRPWNEFAKSDAQEFAKECLTIFNGWHKKKFPNLAESPLSTKAKIFDILQKKRSTVLEKAPSTQEDEYTTDEDNELELTHTIQHALSDPLNFRNLGLKEINSHVKRLNYELKSGKTEENIDWSKYPRFFIAQYRGIHYYRHYFSKNQRADHRATSHLNRMAPAPAVYFRSGLVPNQHQLARESEMHRGREDLREVFEKLSDSGPARQYWGDKKRVFDNQSDMMQQRMSNSYKSFGEEIANPGHPAPEIFFKNGFNVGYPHYATSDLPTHGLKYAFGQKQIDGLTEHRLRPVFQESGKTTHPYPGKLFITLFSPLAMYKHQARSVAGKHNQEQLFLNQRGVAQERETSVPGGVDAELTIYEELMVIPSFESFDPILETTHGITESQFKNYQDRIKDSLTHPDKGERDKIRKKVKNEIIESIIKHKELELLRYSFREAQRLGGYLIFRYTNGRYGLFPEKMRVTRHGERYTYTEREEQLITFIETLWKGP